MQKDLFIMERAIALNIYQPRQARYRGLDIVPGKSYDSLWAIGKLQSLTKVLGQIYTLGASVHTPDVNTTSPA